MYISTEEDSVVYILYCLPFNDRCIPFPDNVWQRSKNKIHFHQQMQLTQAPTQHISWNNQQNLKIQLPLISLLLHSNKRITMIRIVSLIPFQFREQYGFQCLRPASFSPGGSGSGQFKKLKITGGKQTKVVYTQIGYSIMCSHNSTQKRCQQGQCMQPIGVCHWQIISGSILCNGVNEIRTIHSKT